MEYKLVPVDPTVEMVVAGIGAYRATSDLAFIRGIVADIGEVMIAAATSPEWIPVSERLPGRADGDEEGYLWVSDGNVVTETRYENVVVWSSWDYWMPKPRQEPPAPPKKMEDID